MKRQTKLDQMLDRRDFVRGSLLAMLGGVTITIAGCGGSPVSPTSSFPADETAQILDNHGHIAVITGAQLLAGGALILNIQGDGTHNHTVELSAAEVAQIRDGQRVAKQSSETTHSHTITFND